MKILQISNRVPYPLTDGGAIGIYNITKFLHEQGHEVVFLTVNTNKHHQPLSVMQDVCSRAAGVDIDTTISASGAFWNIFKRLPYNIDRFFVPAFSELLRQTLKNEKFDVIHIDAMLMAPYIDVIRTASMTPIVMRMHNVEYTILERLSKNSTNLAKKFYYYYLAERTKAMEMHYLKLCDGVLAITPEEEHLIRKMGYLGKIAVVPAGVDLEMFKPRPHIITKPNTLFFIGSLEWSANQEAVRWLMDKVMPHVRKEFPNIELHIIGKRIPNEFHALGDMPFTYLHSDVPSAPDAMQTYDIQLVPIRSGGGMRLKIVEGFGMEKAIVSTSLGAEGIYTKHGENIMIADSGIEFAKCITTLLRDEERKTNIGKNARSVAEKFYSWPHLVREMVHFYQKVIS